MKKYLLVPGPLLLGVLLSFLFAFRQASYDPDTASPHATQATYHYLSYTWLVIGIGLSFTLLLLLGLYDVLTFLDKGMEKRSIRKSREGEKP